ncbi:MAG: hypothetical protein ACRD5D_09235 [Candidatus Polarisedimenticolia bacterium]
MTNTTLQPVGTWVGAAFGRLKERFWTLSALYVFGLGAALFAVALVYALGFVFVGFLQGWENLARLLQDPRRLGYFLDASQGAFTLFNLLAGFVALRLYCWVLQAAIHASLDPALGFRAALGRGKGRGYSFLLLFLLQQIAVQAGAMLLFVPGIILAVFFGFAFWVFVKEGTGVLQSLRGSARAVRGHFFVVLGRMLLLGLIGGVMMIVPVLGWLAGAAWMMVAWALLYEDLRGPAPRTSPAVRPALRGRPERVARAGVVG